MKSNKDYNAPKSINGYQLLKQIDKKYLTNYSVGIYTKSRKKFFIKSWSSNRIDYEYYSLINEFNITSILHKHSSKVKQGINFVKAIELIEDSNRVSAVYQFIEGKSLDKYSLAKQSNIMSEIIRTLPELTNKITKQNLKYFSKRSLSWFVFTLPMRLINVEIPNKSKIKIFIQSFKYYVTNISNNNLELAHRDLTPENIMIDKNGKVYLIDLEQVCLTFKGYDTQNFLISPQNQKSIQYLSTKAPLLNNYITTLIAIHSLANESLPEFVKYYSKFINIF